jgi:hypothetical protein
VFAKIAVKIGNRVGLVKGKGDIMETKRMLTIPNLCSYFRRHILGNTHICKDTELRACGRGYRIEGPISLNESMLRQIDIFRHEL